MTPLRWTLLAVCMAVPALAYRLGGVGLWVTYATAYGIAAALAAREFAADGQLRGALSPQRGDAAFGFGSAALFYLALLLAFRYVIAPGSFLPLCGPDGALFGQPGVHGLGVVTEWLRDRSCAGFARSSGIRGPARGVLVVAIAAAEELAWRGGVQQGLSERLGSTRGWLAATGLYALAQFGTGNAATVLLALAAGLLFGALFRYRGRLAPALFAHCTFAWFFLYQQPVLALPLH